VGRLSDDRTGHKSARKRREGTEERGASQRRTPKMVRSSKIALIGREPVGPKKIVQKNVDQARTENRVVRDKKDAVRLVHSLTEPKIDRKGPREAIPG